MYAGILPSRKAVAMAIWRVGMQPAGSNWRELLYVAQIIESEWKQQGIDQDGVELPSVALPNASVAPQVRFERTTSVLTARR